MILGIENVTKVFPVRGRGLFGKHSSFTALKGVDLSVTKGESFGLVGESGSGKTTLTRCILRLDDVTSGRIVFDDVDLATVSPPEMRRLRSRLQIVFQDPYASLNPRMTVHDIVVEPLEIHRDE